MKVLDPGHRYKLLTLDGDLDQTLQFVKREGDKFPGNVGSYPGTTLQSVLRALIDRIGYLQNQVWSFENVVIKSLLVTCIWLLEFRAARRHGIPMGSHPVSGPMCPICGHTICHHADLPLSTSENQKG